MANPTAKAIPTIGGTTATVHKKPAAAAMIPMTTTPTGSLDAFESAASANLETNVVDK
jgi:hypothetical protein